jgi:hypothetical protein
VTTQKTAKCLFLRALCDLLFNGLDLPEFQYEKRISNRSTLRAQREEGWIYHKVTKDTKITKGKELRSDASATGFY